MQRLSPNKGSPLNIEELSVLVARAKAGSGAAFEELYHHYLTPIYRFVYLRVKTREDAEELTQVTFMKAWNGLTDFEDQGKPFAAWLYTIARHTVIDHWKKRREVRLDEEGELAAQIPDTAPLPHDSVERTEEARRLRAMVSSLSEDQQEIIILKFIQDLTNREIAAITGKSEDALRQLQFRALKALRGRLKDKGLGFKN